MTFLIVIWIAEAILNGAFDRIKKRIKYYMQKEE